MADVLSMISIIANISFNPVTKIRTDEPDFPTAVAKYAATVVAFSMYRIDGI